MNMNAQQYLRSLSPGWITRPRTYRVIVVVSVLAAGIALTGLGRGSRPVPLQASREAAMAVDIHTRFGEHLREQASQTGNPALVIGTQRGRIQNRAERPIFFGVASARVTVRASYEAAYGYPLRTLDRSYRVKFEDDQLVVLLRQPDVLFAASVDTESIRVSHKNRWTRLLGPGAWEQLLHRAQHPLTTVATVDARRRVGRSRQVRRLTEHTVRDVLLSFLDEAYPGFARRYHNRIEIRFEDDPWKIEKVARR